MKLFKSWPFYVVLAVFVGYLIFSGDDESPKEGKKSPADVAQTPDPSPPGTQQKPPPWQLGGPYQTPAAPPTGYPAYPGQDYPARDYPADPARTGQYRFRPMGPDQESHNPTPYQPPSYSFSDQQGGYAPMPGQQPPQHRVQPYPVPGQDEMNYRFRPLDQSQQSKRWSGNYPNPYLQRNYYAPQNRPVPRMGGDSLWAESAPKR